MSKAILQAVALAAAVLASFPALAQEKLPDVRVYYGDLDLSDPAGIRSLDRRLTNAVEAVCPSDNGVREMSELRVIHKCRADKRAEIAPLRATALANAAGDKSFAVLAR